MAGWKGETESTVSSLKNLGCEGKQKSRAIGENQMLGPRGGFFKLKIKITVKKLSLTEERTLLFLSLQDRILYKYSTWQCRVYTKKQKVQFFDQYTKQNITQVT